MTPELIGVIVSGVLALVGVWYGAYRAGKTTVKVKELDVDGKAYLRAEGITTGLIETLRKQIEDLNKRLDDVEGEVRQVRDHNNALIRYCYRLIDILRAVGHTDKIPSPPPDGIHI